MKKLIALIVCLAMVMLAVACKTPAVETPAATEAPAATEEPVDEPTDEEPEAPAAEKTGLYINTSVSDSVSAGDADGKAKADALIVAVTVDADGVITGCYIDSVQATIGFSGEGLLTTDKTTTFLTKNELGADYGMSAYSPIGKEWNEQAEAFAAYCIGKTAAEVSGIALNEDGTATDADLTSSVTIHVGGFISAVANAAQNATEQGAAAGNKLGLAAVTNMTKSKDATAEADGVAQAYSTYAVVTVDEAGMITSCIIDAVQANVKFDATGNITTDLTAAVQSKNELGENYGMAAASAIGKEWNEQAAAFAACCIGKTAEEVRGIAMDDSGLAADADLLASVTIHIGDFMNVVATAADNAK